jgi:ATP-dependent RNA helicase RhlE
LVGPADDFHLNNIEKLIRMKIEEKELPPEVEIAESSREEKQSVAREVDRQRKLADPEFKGAFHEKKFHPHKKSSRNRKKP